MNPYKKVAFHTLGCKLNFSETSTIARLFEQGGYARVEPDERPDVFVLNTCSVTDQADKKCRYEIRKVKSANPETFVVVIGCYAQLKPAEIAEMEGVDLVLGANEKFNVLEHLEKSKDEGTRIFSGHIKETRDFVPSYSAGDRTRSFLKIQDGCDYFCSFCTIPLARGRSRNQSIEETLKSVYEVAATDVREIVLTGVNIGDFGQNKNGEDFLGLIRELDKVEGIERFRISSIEPNLLENEIIDFVAASKKFVPHFHIPLQSGSNEILQLMRRRYQRELYADRVTRIKAAMPDACIGVDVIVGFPTEDDANFSETYEFIQSIDVSYLHVFTYSERANTTAVRMEEIVPMEKRNERSKMLRNLSHKKLQAFYESQAGKTKTVLWESENREGFMHGFTENYIKLQKPFDPDSINQLETVILQNKSRSGIYTIENSAILM